MKLVAVILASVLAFATCTPPYLNGDLDDGYGAGSLIGEYSAGYGGGPFITPGYGRFLSLGYGGTLGGGIGFGGGLFLRGRLGFGLGLRRRFFGLPYFSGYPKILPYGYGRGYGIGGYGSKFGGKHW